MPQAFLAGIPIWKIRSPGPRKLRGMRTGAYRPRLVQGLIPVKAGAATKISMAEDFRLARSIRQKEAPVAKPGLSFTLKAR